MTLSERARTYATEKHAATNHQYDDKPYAFHLGMVAEAAKMFIGNFEPEIQEIILSGCWCHDIIEDARETYNDVKKELGEEVAEIAYALTNEKGRTRKERANETYYAGIRNTPYATLIKICDRIANVQHSINKQSRMLDIYRKEYEGFKGALYQEGEWEDAWRHLDGLLK